MAPSGQSTTITHPPLTWKEQLSLLRGTTFCVPHPDRGQKAQQKQRCSSSKPVNTVQVGSRTGTRDARPAATSTWATTRRRAASTSGRSPRAHRATVSRTRPGLCFDLTVPHKGPSHISQLLSVPDPKVYVG